MTTATHTAVSKPNTVARYSNFGNARVESREHEVLNAQQFAGPFSLVDHEPVLIDSAPGLEVHVYRGSLWITEIGSAQNTFLRDGERFVATGSNALMVSTLKRAELQIVQPQ